MLVAEVDGPVWIPNGACGRSQASPVPVDRCAAVLADRRVPGLAHTPTVPYIVHITVSAVKCREAKMTIVLSQADEMKELRVDDVEPAQANVKYAQLRVDEIEPAQANVKYAQL